MLSDTMLSLIRTGVPALVGWLVQLLATGLGLEVPALAADQAAAGLTVVVGLAYYGGVRIAEQKWPAAGWLLGAPKVPVYDLPTGEWEWHEVKDPATGAVVETRSITRYPNHATDQPK